MLRITATINAGILRGKSCTPIYWFEKAYCPSLGSWRCLAVVHYGEGRDNTIEDIPLSWLENIRIEK